MKKRRKDLKEIQDRLVASQSKPVRLRVAASVVHNDLTRQSRNSMRGPDYIAALNRAAAALSQVADIYHLNDERRLLRIPEEDLVSGSFEDGGNVLRAPSGKIYKALSVRRID